MADDAFGSAEHKMKRAVEILQRDYANIRTGRASPNLLDRIQVDYYGTPTPLNGLATITVPEPRMRTIAVGRWPPKITSTLVSPK